MSVPNGLANGIQQHTAAAPEDDLPDVEGNFVPLGIIVERLASTAYRDLTTLAEM